MADKMNKAKAGLMNNKFFPDMSKLKKKDDSGNTEAKKQISETKPEHIKQKPKAEKEIVEKRAATEIEEVPVQVQEEVLNIKAEKSESEKTDVSIKENVQFKAAEETDSEPKPKAVAKHGAVKLHIVARHNGKNKSTLNLTMPGIFRKCVEKLAKENERPMNYILGLLLEYALEVNPMPEFPTALGLPMDDPWKTIYHIPSDLKEDISTIGAKNGRSLIFTVNALIKYTLETIGELAKI